MTESSSNDPKNVWRSQETEQLSMSLDEIRTTARRFQTRGRVTTAFLGALFAFIAVANLGELSGTTDWIRIAAIVISSAGWLVWSIQSFRGFRLAYGALPEDAGLETSVAFYRRSLAEAPRGFRRGLPGLILIVLGTVGMLLRPETPLTRGIENTPPSPIVAWLPFVILLASWVFVMVYSRKFSSAWVKREIQRLERIQQTNRDLN